MIPPNYRPVGKPRRVADLIFSSVVKDLPRPWSTLRVWNTMNDHLLVVKDLVDYCMDMHDAAMEDIFRDLGFEE